MNFTVDKSSSNRCALDAKKFEPFTQKSFSDLIFEAHSKGQDYYIARLQCKDSDNTPYFYSYDAKHVCKFVFEMIISSEGRQIRIKNFKDPIHAKDIMEINFFRMSYESETPLKAEYAGNHISFLESNTFRSKIFGQDEALDALSVNFQFKSQANKRVIPKRKFLMFLGLTIALILFGTLSFFIIKRSKEYMAISSEKQGKILKNTGKKPVEASAQNKPVTVDKPHVPKMIKVSPDSLRSKNLDKITNDTYIKI